MTYLTAFITWLGDFIRANKTAIGAVLSTILIKDAWRDAEREQRRSEALEARIKAGNAVNAMPTGEPDRLLQSEWTQERRFKLRGSKSNTGK